MEREDDIKIEIQICGDDINISKHLLLNQDENEIEKLLKEISEWLEE